MGQFINFLKENNLNEGIFDFLKKKKVEDPLDVDIHTQQPVIGQKLKKSEKDLANQDAEERLINYGLGNFGQALETYGMLNKNYYSTSLINKIKNSPVYNKKWQQYRDLFVSALKAKQKETLKRIIDKAFEEMNVPKPDAVAKDYFPEPEAKQELIKKSNDKYLQDVANAVSEELKINKDLNSDSIRDFILNKFSDFKKRYPKTWQMEIGRVRKMVTKPKLLKLTKADLKPEKEDRNILSFQNYVAKRNAGRA